MAFSGASHRPHSSGACPPKGQSSGPLSPESPRPLRATQVPGPVVLQPRRLPTPSRSGDLRTFLGAPCGSATCMAPGRFGPLVGCRGHGHLRVRVVRAPPSGCEHTGEQVLLIRHLQFSSVQSNQNRRMTNRRTSDGRRERPRHSRVSSFGERLAVHQRSHRPACGWRRSTSTRAVVSSRHGMTGTGCISSCLLARAGSVKETRAGF